MVKLWVKKWSIGIGFLLMVLFFTSCNTDQTATRIEKDPKGTFQVDVKVVPNPAKILKENEFQVTIKNKEGQTIAAKVEISLSMADMDHGDLRIPMVPQGGGIYLGKGIPVMAGEWIASVKVESGGETSVIKYYFQAVR